MKKIKNVKQHLLRLCFEQLHTIKVYVFTELRLSGVHCSVYIARACNAAVGVLVCGVVCVCVKVLLKNLSTTLDQAPRARCSPTCKSWRLWAAALSCAEIREKRRYVMACHSDNGLR